MPKRPTEATVEVDTVHLDYDGRYGWEVISECGVVKVRSTRDGYMLAVAPPTARRIAAEFFRAMSAAADMTEMRSYGSVREPTRKQYALACAGYSHEEIDPGDLHEALQPVLDDDADRGGDLVLCERFVTEWFSIEGERYAEMLAEARETTEVAR